MPQGDDEKDDKNDKEKTANKKSNNSNKKLDKIYQEIELVEKIYIPEENDSNIKRKRKRERKVRMIVIWNLEKMNL